MAAKQVEPFSACIDSMPGARKSLRVKGKLEVPTSGWSARLTAAIPQGIVPEELLLDLALMKPSGTVLQVVSVIEARYDEVPPKHDYSNVTIREADGTETHVPVKSTS